MKESPRFHNGSYFIYIFWASVSPDDEKNNPQVQNIQPIRLHHFPICKPRQWVPWAGWQVNLHSREEKEAQKDQETATSINIVIYSVPQVLSERGNAGEVMVENITK